MAMNLKMMLGAIGFDPDAIMKQVEPISQNVQYMAGEIAAQGAMIRSICKHLGLPVIPQAPQPGQEIDHADQS